MRTQRVLWFFFLVIMVLMIGADARERGKTREKGSHKKNKDNPMPPGATRGRNKKEPKIAIDEDGNEHRQSNKPMPPGAKRGHNKKEPKIVIDEDGNEHRQADDTEDPGKTAMAEHWFDEDLVQTYQALMQGKIDDDQMQKEIVDFLNTGKLREDSLQDLKEIFGDDTIRQYCEDRQGGSRRARRAVNEANVHRVRRAAMYPTNAYWEQNIVPYRFDDEYPETDATKALVLDGLREFERVTCVRFVEYTPTIHAELGLGHTTTLSFGDYGGGCWSFVGRTKAEFQKITTCSGSVTVHEVTHALGSHHEQRRSDANTVLQFYLNNVESSGLNEFIPMDSDNRVPYSLSSYMHYNEKFASLNGENTMIPYDLDMEFLFDAEENNYVYFMDAEAINLAYQCKDIHCPSFSLTCANHGYVGYVEDACQCVCPSGLTGPTCEEPLQIDPDIVSWPQDGFTLPMSFDGCPQGFSTGTRKQSLVQNPYEKDYGDLNLPDGSITDPLYFTHHFCVANPGTFSGTDDFPAGSYCIYRTGGTCPTGFTEGHMLFDDINHDEAAGNINQNSYDGSLPDGVFDQDTLFYYCCRRDKPAEVPIKFPSSEPFQLLVGEGDDKCQQIEGMSYEKGSYCLTTEVELDDFQGAYPYYPENWRNNYNLTRYYFCYYEPRPSETCGGVYELTDQNPTITISSPNYPANYSNGERCYWTVKGPEDRLMSIHFTHFDIKTVDESTCDDTLEVRHVSVANPGVRYCGDQFSRFLVTYDSYAMLVLDTNSADAATGFEATISVLYDEDFGYDLDYDGKTYSGDIGFTQRFQPCLYWDDVKHCPFSMYNNKAVLGPHNYCRNPTEATRPWCYIDTDCYSDVCDIVGDGIPEPDCPQGYQKLVGSCYKVSTVKARFKYVEEACVNEGGQVVSIHTEEEQAAVESLLSDTGAYYYTGLTDRVVEGTFVWTDGSDPTYTNWAPPSYIKTKDCVVMRWISSENKWMWDDIACGYKKNYICEIPLPPYGTVCDTPPAMPHATIINGTVKSYYQEGEYITYKCNIDNYGEEVTRTCMTNGDWSGHDRMCGACPTQYEELVTNGCYWVSNMKRKYVDASAICEKDGGSLVKLEDATEESAVINLINILSGDPSDRYLIGLNDIVTEGVYEWQDGTSPTYVNWAPSNYTGGYWYDCNAERLIDETGLYMWDDVQCKTAYYFICEVHLDGGYCDDTRDDCDEILIWKPNICTEDLVFAKSACKSTCGYCP